MLLCSVHDILESAYVLGSGLVVPRGVVHWHPEHGSVPATVTDSFQAVCPGFHLGALKKKKKKPYELQPFTVRNSRLHTSCQQEVGFGKNSIFGIERPPLTQKCAAGWKMFLCSVLLDLLKEWRNVEECDLSRTVSSQGSKMTHINHILGISDFQMFMLVCVTQVTIVLIIQNLQ